MTFTRDDVYCLQAQYRRKHTCNDTDSRDRPLAMLAKDSDAVFLLNAQSTRTDTYHNWSCIKQISMQAVTAYMCNLSNNDHGVNEFTLEFELLMQINIDSNRMKLRLSLS